VDIQTHVFLTAALVGGECSASRAGCFTPGVRASGTMRTLHNSVYLSARLKLRGTNSRRTSEPARARWQTEKSLNSITFRDMTPCSPTEVRRNLRETNCLHLQGRRLSLKEADSNENRSACRLLLLVGLLLSSLL
jgi:hypothetical protein